MFTAKEQLIVSLQRRGNRLKQWGLTDATMLMGMTIKYLDTDQALFRVLGVCRDFNDLLTDEVLKQSLLRASQQTLKGKRAHLWLRLLKIDTRSVQLEYEMHR